MDKLRVQQILMNIMSNAVKFSHEGGTVELDIECRELSGGRACDKFVITDHGVGMSREFLPQIFEPFEQEKDLTTMDFGGSGVGMAITKRLVELMGGTIEVRSVKGAGTTVTVCLAFERCAEEPAREAARQAQREIPAGTRLLLCEDNHMTVSYTHLWRAKTKTCSCSSTNGAGRMSATASLSKTPAPRYMIMT